MLVNLEKVLRNKGITLEQYADFLGISEPAVRARLEGSADFTYSEFRRTCTLLLPEYNADFLFAESFLEDRSA